MISIVIHPHQDIVQSTHEKRKKSSFYREIIDANETNLILIVRYVTLDSFITSFSSKSSDEKSIFSTRKLRRIPLELADRLFYNKKNRFTFYLHE